MNMKFASSALFRSVAAAGVLAGAMSGSHAATQSFDVFARENSTAFTTNDISPGATLLDTGVSFTAGSPLTITAGGLATGDPSASCGVPNGPDGTSCYTPSVRTDPVTGFTYFSLVGKVDGGSFFKVGSSFSGTASNTGHLFLGFLDIDAANNSGKFTALVTLPSAVPEPETYAMMLAGLGMLAFVARRKAGKRD